jgi:hypothetical protein
LQHPSRSSHTTWQLAHSSLSSRSEHVPLLQFHQKISIALDTTDVKLSGLYLLTQAFHMSSDSVANRAIWGATKEFMDKSKICDGFQIQGHHEDLVLFLGTWNGDLIIDHNNSCMVTALNTPFPYLGTEKELGEGQYLCPPYACHAI